jgi:hypothetical protein
MEPVLIVIPSSSMVTECFCFMCVFAWCFVSGGIARRVFVVGG